MKEEEPVNLLFKEIIGQTPAINLLKAALKKKQIANAYLFTGIEGIGRKLTSLRFIEGLINNGYSNTSIRRRIESRNHPDLLWIEPTYKNQGKLITQSVAANEKFNSRNLPQIRLEQIKEVKRFAGEKPVESNSSIVLIEDIERINESAANALLKTLEEPSKSIFILISERPELILKTILSRCQKITFHRLDINSIQEIFNSKDASRRKYYSTISQTKELLSLANGSPGSIIKHMESWENIPIELWPRIKSITNQKPIEALSLAKDLVDELDLEQQIWIIQWLQQHFWIKENNFDAIKKLEKLRIQIQSFVNTRLAWEITLLKLNKH